jgi:hypothetical protein
MNDEKAVGEATWGTIREEASGFRWAEGRGRQARGERDEEREQRESQRAARVFQAMGRRAP